MKSIIHIDFISIEKETEKAVQVNFGGDHMEWFPRSQVSISENEKVIGIPKWLYNKKFPEGVD